jgi:hypothetical protein
MCDKMKMERRKLKIEGIHKYRQALMDGRFDDTEQIWKEHKLGNETRKLAAILTYTDLLASGNFNGNVEIALRMIKDYNITKADRQRAGNSAHIQKEHPFQCSSERCTVTTVWFEVEEQLERNHNIKRLIR